MNFQESENLAKVWEAEFRFGIRAKRMITELILIVSEDIDLKRQMSNGDYREFIFHPLFLRTLRGIANRDVQRRRELLGDDPKKTKAGSGSYSLALVHLASNVDRLKSLINQILGEKKLEVLMFLDKD